MPVAPALHSRASDEWWTPPEVFEPLNCEFDFTIDACAPSPHGRPRPVSLYRTCERCRSRPATNGRVCVVCVQHRHCWEGTAHLSHCLVCGVVRYKRRKRTWPGQQGSRWQTWYDIDPSSGEKPNTIPLCH